MDDLDPHLTKQLFRLLRISPTYELARQASSGQLSGNTPLPPYFAQVQHTYELLGDVCGLSLNDWLQENEGDGNVFVEGSEPQVFIAGGVRFDGTPDHTAIAAKLDGYMQGITRCRHQSNVGLLAIPLNVPRERILEQVRDALALLDSQAFKSRFPTPERPPLDELWTDPTFKKLEQGVNLLERRAEQLAGDPKFPLWKSGRAQYHWMYGNVEFTEGHQSQWDPEVDEEKTKYDDETTARNNLKKRVHGDLAKFQNIAENVACGVYNSDKPLDGVLPWDYPAIHTRLQDAVPIPTA